MNKRKASDFSLLIRSEYQQFLDGCDLMGFELLYSNIKCEQSTGVSQTGPKRGTSGDNVSSSRQLASAYVAACGDYVASLRLPPSSYGYIKTES